MVTWLDQHDADAKLPRLEAERLAHALDGEFAGAVEPAERRAEETRERADVDDVAAALAPHRRQHGAAEAEHAEEIRLELRLRLGDGRVLHRAYDRPASIVDERVDASRASEHRRDTKLDRAVIVDVERDHLDAGSGDRRAAAAGAESAPAFLASAAAIAAPMPEEAPVTSTTFCCSRPEPLVADTAKLLSCCVAFFAPGKPWAVELILPRRAAGRAATRAPYNSAKKLSRASSEMNR